MESTSYTSPDDVKTIETLARGLLELYEPPLVTINTHLKELTEKQEAIRGMITCEQQKMEDSQNDAMMDAMLADIATSREKLVSISSSVIALHKRAKSLQMRAANIEKAAKSKAQHQSASEPSWSKAPTSNSSDAQCSETTHCEASASHS